MNQYESFGECLKRCLHEQGMSASEASRIVGFRSRNSIFRIIAGDTGNDVKLRFLEMFREAIGDQWPDSCWAALQEALSVERLGVEGYLSRCAFEQVLYTPAAECNMLVMKMNPDGTEDVVPLADVLDKVSAAPKAEIVITGCYDSDLARLLVDHCGMAGAEGRLTMRHYIDISDQHITQNILGVLPLIAMPWFNARLVNADSCADETLALYRMHAMHISYQTEDGIAGGMFIRLDKKHFASKMEVRGAQDFISVLDRHRFELKLLKPLPDPSQGVEGFVAYTEEYRQMESDCFYCSIKPDVHFNLLPRDVLEDSAREGFQQAGLADGEALDNLISVLTEIHMARLENMLHKRKPTHIVYSLSAMEQFMRTGVQTDHFFIQRAYTLEERRMIIRLLLDTMRENPWFNIYFLKDTALEPRYEITMYGDKGVLMLSAYTGYDLYDDHTQAFITLPAFVKSFRNYFMEELLDQHVLSRAENIKILEHLLEIEPEG